MFGSLVYAKIPTPKVDSKFSPRGVASLYLPHASTFNDPNDYNDNFADKTPDNYQESVFQSKSINGLKPPTCYTKLEIHYSKFGMDDFDFDYYNHSNGLYAGLENHSDNSYANSLLQLYWFIPIFYNTATESPLSEYLPNDKATISVCKV